MSSFYSACKTFRVSSSPSSREYTCDTVGLILSQGGCLMHEQGQMLGSEHDLLEMTELECSHIQHLIQGHTEAQGGTPDARSHPDWVLSKHATGSAVTSPFIAAQAIDLSTSIDEHCQVMPGEKTPATYGEVPGFVLARIRDEDSPNDPPADSSTFSQKRSRSAARVCLEKRFNTMSADMPRQQDMHSAVLGNFLTILQQSAEAQEAVIHPQMQRSMKVDKTNTLAVSSPYARDVLNLVSNTCGQVIGHIPHICEPNMHQDFIIPKSFSFNICPETVVKKANYTSSSNPAEEQQLVTTENDVTPPAASKKHSHTHCSKPLKAAKSAPRSAGEAGSSTRKRARSCMSLSQRRDRHNNKERERRLECREHRKRIRSCCDELNMLVPFCDSDTDKVTTLYWTTAFLRYISKTYGDTFKEEFQKSFCDEKGLFLKSSGFSGEDPNHQEMGPTGPCKPLRPRGP
uniref:transcription factor-like 5 protein n=1 Tax=Monopterus albus TaxID=43700 RepID=UPI0009B42B6C|nr:transcription factor-like 5 protein [Monopterus albus]